MLAVVSFTTPVTVSSTGAALVTSTLPATAEPGAPVYSTLTSSPRLTFRSAMPAVFRAKFVPSARVTMILPRDASFTTPSTTVDSGSGSGSGTLLDSGAGAGSAGAAVLAQPVNKVSIMDRAMSRVNSFFIVVFSSAITIHKFLETLSLAQNFLSLPDTVSPSVWRERTASPARKTILHCLSAATLSALPPPAFGAAPLPLGDPGHQDE